MSKYKVLKDNLKNIVGIEFERTLPIITEEYEAKIRRQAAEITRLLAENKELKEENKRNYTINIEMARAEGKNEAWELVRKIFDMETNDIEDIFIKEDAWNLGTVLNNYTYPEAAAKVAEWEKAKEEIKVGDVVESNNEEKIIWHEVIKRPPTEEEKEAFDCEPEYILDCEMPDDEQEILIVTGWGVDTDICGIDEGYYLENRGDWDDVIAWEEIPKYKAGEQE